MNRHFAARDLQRILDELSTTMIHATAVLLVFAFAEVTAFADPQDTPDVQMLQQKIELLEAKLQDAEKEIELLKNKLETQTAENARLRSVDGATQDQRTAKTDSFEEGSTWLGVSRRVDSPPVRWVLTVTERKGGAFKGTVTAHNPEGKVRDFNVQGRAPVSDRGLVEFKSENIAFGQISLRGNLKDGTIALIFVGRSPFGELGTGTVSLKRADE